MNVFYMLFPDHIRDEAEKVDVDLSDAQGRQKAIEEKFKETDLPSDERAALEKEQQQVEEEVANLIAAQNKLYDEALATVEVTPEKIKIAKRLLQISQFINDGFNQIAAATVALTVKMVDDVMATNFSRTQIENSLAYLVTQGIISKANAKKRVILIGKAPADPACELHRHHRIRHGPKIPGEQVFRLPGSLCGNGKEGLMLKVKQKRRLL